MYAEPRRHLIALVERFGPCISSDVKRCSAMLNDLCRNEHFAARNLLITAVRDRCVAQIEQLPSGADATATLRRLARRLHDRYGVREELALWAVESWGIALGRVVAPSIRADTSSVPAESIVGGWVGLGAPAANAPAVPNAAPKSQSDSHASRQTAPALRMAANPQASETVNKVAARSKIESEMIARFGHANFEAARRLHQRLKNASPSSPLAQMDEAAFTQELLEEILNFTKDRSARHKEHQTVEAILSRPDLFQFLLDEKHRTSLLHAITAWGPLAPHTPKAAPDVRQIIQNQSIQNTGKEFDWKQYYITNPIVNSINGVVVVNFIRYFSLKFEFSAKIGINPKITYTVIFFAIALIVFIKTIFDTKKYIINTNRINFSDQITIGGISFIVYGLLQKIYLYFTE